MRMKKLEIFVITIAIVIYTLISLVIGFCVGVESGRDAAMFEGLEKGFTVPIKGHGEIKYEWVNPLLLNESPKLEQ